MWLLLFVQLILGQVLGVERCPVPHLENGRAREKGKFARNIRFNCRRDYQLLGEKYAHCVRGAWNVEVPVCIKPGCRWSRYEYMNGLFLESYRGALVKVECNPGYITPGPPVVYCDGTRWNGTFPVCKPRDEEPLKSCDFEEEDLCGWSQDPNNRGINWKQGQQLKFDKARPEDPSPSGKYMYFDSQSVNSRTTTIQAANFTSKLYSPVYPPSFSSKITCFSLVYYMHGSTAGVLKVYFMLEGQRLESIIPDLWIQGDQGTNWQKGVFRIAQPKRDYQIVIEGTRGSGFEIAFDDVNIGYDEECEEKEETTTENLSSTTDSFDSIDDFTCLGRCSAAAVLTGTDITADELEETPRCDCHPACVHNSTCCADYQQFCIAAGPGVIYGTTEEDARSSSNMSSHLSSTTFPPSKPSPPPPSQSHPNFNPPAKFAPAMPTNTTTTLIPITTKVTTQTKPNTMKIIQATTAKILTTVAKRIQFNVNNSNEKNETHKQRTSVPTATKATSKKPLTTTDRSNMIPILPFTAIPPSKSKMPVHGITFNKSRFQTSGPTVQEAVRSDVPSEPHLSIPLSLVVEVSAGVAVVLLLAACITVFLLRRRRRRAEHDNMAEDSDSILFGLGSSDCDELYSSSSSLMCIRSSTGMVSTL